MNKRRRRRARKSTLSKPRKPKILSLHCQILLNEMPPAADYRQLDLFPLQPETDRESQDQAENVALFFSAADCGATTLTGLLDNDNSSAVDSNSSQSNNSSRVDYLTPSPASLTYSYGEERAALVRTALRSRDRESSDEKWVRYSEVVERKVNEEVTSSAVDRWPAAVQRVLLKLDYDEIINAWSDKGPLFVDADSSQIVPDVKDCFLSHLPSDYEVSGWGCNSLVWRVPEIENEEEMKNKMVGERKASLLRYKEKRQNRLFSKKIRYQVRKLNAEKRPRLKGRFVKKS